MIGVGIFNNAINSFFHGRKVFLLLISHKVFIYPLRLIINHCLTQIAVIEPFYGQIIENYFSLLNLSAMMQDTRG